MAGRHSASSERPRSRAVPVIGVVVAAAVLGVGGFTLVGNAGTEPAAAECGGQVTVKVAVAPEIAPVVSEAARNLETGKTAVDGRCVVYEVDPTSPELVAQVLSAEPENAPDLWIPDFSVWVTRAERSGTDLTQVSESLASTPVVVAGPDAQAPSSWQEVGTSTVAYLDPLTSSASTVALLSAFGEAATTGASRTEIGSMMVPLAQRYGGQPDKPETVEEVAEAAEQGTLGVLTEQQLVKLQADGKGESLDAVVPKSGTMLLDYPLAAVSPEESAVEAGRRLATFLSGPTGTEMIAAEGFRDSSGTPLSAGRGLGTEPYDVVPSPKADDVTGAMRQWAMLTVPSRILAVVDVSGSMDFVDSGTPRISLAVTAAAGALELFPDNAEIGVWAFSEKLGPGNRDYTSLAPIRKLGSSSGGTSQREVLGAALRKLPQMTDGGTGLYDTTLAAIRTLQDDHDARAVNSVILLTDGENDDPGSLSLNELMSTIEREKDPARPIQVIAIGMGPDADAQALRRIASATGGRSYVARDPQDIAEVFIDAMLSR